MRIAIAADHNGIDLKELLVRWMSERGHTVDDYGTDSDAPVDYPRFIRPVADAVALLLDALGIEALDAFIGYSYGALVGLQLAARHPQRLRKLVAVDAVAGLGVESVFLFVPALLLLGWLTHASGTPWLAGWGTALAALLVFGGVLTALPLIGFADAVRRIPFSLVGLLQYIAPTLQLLCGVLVLGEMFDGNRAIGFGFIWIALLLYAGDGLLRSRKPQAGAALRPSN